MPPTSECPICTDEFPRERMISCEGRTTHYYCHDCAKEYAKDIIGSLKGVVACCSGDCKAEFSKGQLLPILEPGLASRLELNLQNEVLRRAGMEDLSDCPFCDFKAILPPISEDPLFRCQNFEKCGKTSCRKCDKAAHPGLSCKAADKAKLSEGEDANQALLERLRAELATALSDALICKCNNCKQPFVKSVGCNEMKCQQCGHVQCYACGETLENAMEHYSTGKPCKLFDNTADLEDKKVKQAKAAFLEKVKVTHPDIKESDLEIKMSKEVEKMDQDRRKAWQHPEDLIPVGEIEGESFEDRFNFGTVLDEFTAEEMAFDDGFGDDTFGFGMMFEQSPFPTLQGAAGAHSRSIARATRPNSEQTRTQRTASPAAANTLSRTAGNPGLVPSTTSGIRQNPAARSLRAQTRAMSGFDRQLNDVATSRSQAPATAVASSSRTATIPNSSQRPASTTPARLRATTAQTSSRVLNPNRQTGTGTTIGQLTRPSRGGSVGRSNAQRRASMATSSMFADHFFPAGIYGRGTYPASPYGYGHESIFETYEDPYYDDYDDYDDHFGYGYYGGGRYY